MNKFNELTEKEIMMLEQAGYFIKQNIQILNFYCTKNKTGALQIHI